jgi:hypothetical protein
MPVSIWSNVQVAVQSAIGVANPVTGVTKANPAVVTYTGPDPANGDYILFTAQGMREIDARVFRIANVNAVSNTLELEGVNSTTFNTFSSGSFQLITFGTTLSTLRGLSSSGGDFNFIDVTTIHDQVQKQVPGLSNAATYTFESIWDVADAGLVALKAAADTQAQRAVRFTFSNGQKVGFVGYVGATLLPGGSAQDLVTTQVVVTMFGTPTTYTT